jgi:hypothetical protein
MTWDTFGQVEIDGVTNPVDTWVLLHEVASSSTFLVSGITALNRNATASAKISVAIVKNGESVSDKSMYIDEAVVRGKDADEGGTPIVFGAGITRGAEDEIYVMSDTVDVNFQLFGDLRS